MTAQSRPLTQEELDGFWRNDWIQKVLELLREKRHIKFIVHKTGYSLVEIDDKFGSQHEWEFSIGAQHYYCYRISLMLDFLEKIWDSGVEIISLKGEVQMPKPNHPVAKES